MPKYDKKREKTGMYWDAPYDPNKEYYFVDYYDNYDRRWVRSPYQTWEQTYRLVSRLWSDWGYDPETKEIVQFHSDLHISSERELADLDQVWSDEENKYVNDIVTKRVNRFDGRYDVDEQWTGVPSLTKQKDESLEDWKIRVELATKKKDRREKEKVEKTYASIERIKATGKERKKGLYSTINGFN